METLIFLSIMVLLGSLFVSISIMAISHILIVVPSLNYLVKNFKGVPITKSMWALLGVIGAGVLSVIANWNTVHDKPLIHILKLKYFIISFISIWAYSYWLHKNRDPKKIKLFVNVALISAAIATTSGLIALATGFNPLKFKPACHLSRNCGMFGMYMTYGYGMLYFLMPVSGLLLFYKKINRRYPNFLNFKILFFSWAINFIGFVLSFARGALIALILSLPFYFFKTSKKKFLYATITLIIVLTSLVAFNSKFYDNFFNEERMESVKIRFSMFQTVWVVFKEHPLLGIGYRDFEPSVAYYKTKYDLPHKEFLGHAHNNFLEHLASTGLIGLIAFILFHLFWLKEMYDREDIIAKLTFPLIIALIISGQTQYTLGDGENLFFLMFIYALSQISLRKGDLEV